MTLKTDSPTAGIRPSDQPPATEPGEDTHQHTLLDSSVLLISVT